MDSPDTTIDCSWIEARLFGRRAIPDRAVPPDDLAAARGDHDLNAGMEPLEPLKPAAVLVPLIDRPGQLSVLFTQRTAHLAHHAGQVSFPGGHIEPDDGGPAATALRETEEEVGIEGRHVRLIGHLDTYVTRTGFVIVPVVGIVTPPFAVRPDPHEVADVFEVPLAFLLDSGNHHRCAASFEGVERHFYAMTYGRHFIWGATAGMLMNLYQILTGH